MCEVKIFKQWWIMVYDLKVRFGHKIEIFTTVIIRSNNGTKKKIKLLFHRKIQYMD